MTSWDEVRSGLKPFQIATTDAAFSGLWHDETTSRYLVADEVGLGKTMVAKGVIARTIELLQSKGDKRIDIVYICSNSSIARQNLKKLEEFAGGDALSADRLTKLIATEGLRSSGVNVVALTPGTSFSFGHRSGQFDERALLYAVVKRVWPDKRGVLDSTGGQRVFYYGIGEKDLYEARRRLKAKSQEFDKRFARGAIGIIRPLLAARNKELRAEGGKNLWDTIVSLAPEYDGRKNPTGEVWEQRQWLIGELRQLLAQAGIGLLRPDLVIMDEFQRFADLLDPRSTNKAAVLLRQFVSTTHDGNTSPTKVLLLSATPYRWFDRSGEGSHHSDFLSTLRFLHNGDDQSVQRVEQSLARLRAAIRTDSPDEGHAAAAEASTELRAVMSRTERLSSTPDRHGMLEECVVQTPATTADIQGYVVAQQLGDELNSPAVVELWKTSPWLANLGDGYKLIDNLVGRAETSPLNWADPTLLDIDAVANFRALDPPNPRLRWLIDRTVGAGWHELIWMPPSRRYYATNNAFDRAATGGMTKQLVFSSWRIAPKAISLGLTYAAEQATPRPRVNESTATDDWAGTAYRSHDRSLLDLRLGDEDRAEALTSFLLAAPFSGLANAVDPLTIGASSGPLKSLDEVRRAAVSVIGERLHPILNKGGTGVTDNEWYVYAARWLSDADDGWWKKLKPVAFTGDDKGANKGLRAHIDAFRNPRHPSGRRPDDIAEVLADLALASPAVCSLRSLRRTLDASSSDACVLDAAARIGWGFRSLFDTPEVINVIMAGQRDGRPYWHAVLDYSSEGHLQAVLDEYLHMLREWKVGGATTPDKAADLASAAVDSLAFRTVTLSTRVPTADGCGIDERKLRSRFAVRFGDKSGDDDVDRKDVTASAFNSPFWPFVMATTSIGQEGLDFHLYSHALVHWNLPGDPVSLEQREGRVHRFKGHAVRKNVAADSAHVSVGPDEDLWDAMFESVTSADGDGIKPFWIYEGDAKVERLVPMLPMSREQSAIASLKDSAARYRMAFGQPRHGDLLEMVANSNSIPTIDLSPRPSSVIERSQSG